jgi:hypothetical protein
MQYLTAYLINKELGSNLGGEVSYPDAIFVLFPCHF